MIRIILILCLVFFLGCASSYKPSANFQSQKASMTYDNAMEIISSNIMRTSDQMGVCRSFHEGIPFPEAEPIKMENDKIVYSSFATSKWGAENTRGNFVNGTGKVDITREMESYIFSLDVTQLKTIRILDEDKGGFDCSDSKENILIAIRKGMGEEIAVEIRPERLDEFIAALSYLSPKAKIIQGFGL